MPSTSRSAPSTTDLPYTSDTGYWFYMLRIAFLTLPVIAWWMYSQGKLDQEWVYVALALFIFVSLIPSQYVLTLDETSLQVFKRNFYGPLFSKSTSFIPSEIEEIHLSKWEHYPYPNFYTSGRRRYIAYLDVITHDPVTQEVVRTRFNNIKYLGSKLSIADIIEDRMAPISFPPLIRSVREVKQLLNLPE